MIPLSVPNVGPHEQEQVATCVASGWVSSAGPVVETFERKFAEYVGSSHAIAVCNGTAALHVAMVALGLTAQDEVLLPTITFVATVNAVRYCGASPVFFDCDEFFNLDLAAVESFLAQRCERREHGLFNRSSGRRVWGVLPVHVFGNPVDMPRLVALSQRYGLAVVEDAAESLGSRVVGQHTGTFGVCGCFSFNGNKIITTGGGGMVVTESAELAKRLRYLSTQAKDDPLRFIHNEVGFNYRLTSVQAALGIAQLSRMSEFLDAKRRIFRRYEEAFGSSKLVELAKVPKFGDSNFWLCNVRIRTHPSACASDLIASLREKEIESRPIWWPNHLQRPFTGFESFEISRAPAEVEQVVSIPCSTGLTSVEQEKVIDSIRAWEAAVLLAT